jgi:hypothetical protein
MEFSKKSLVKIMEDVNSMDVEEMALRKSGKQDIRRNPKTNEIIYPKFVAGWHPDNQTKVGEDGIPDYWVVNPTQTEGGEILAVPLDCEELNEFMEKHKDWLEQLRLEHELEPQIIHCTRGKYHRPIETALAGGYKPTGQQYDEQESILRKLNPIIDSYFINSDMENVLEVRSIPTVSRDRKHLDAYGEISNDKIEWGTHSYNSYQSGIDFKKAITDRIKYSAGKIDTLPENFKSHYLARQFNQVYSNWYETKKNEKKYRGKTPRYILDRFGLETDNLDVTVRLDFRIKGTLNRVNSTYRWEVKMIIKFGKKLQDEYTIQGGLRDTKEILTTKEVNFELDRPYTEFDNKYTVLDNVSIKQGLIEAFDDIKNQVQSLKPSYMLGAATSTRLDLPEGKIENLINKIIQEIKK